MAVGWTPPRCLHRVASGAAALVSAGLAQAGRTAFDGRARPVIVAQILFHDVEQAIQFWPDAEGSEDPPLPHMGQPTGKRMAAHSSTHDPQKLLRGDRNRLPVYIGAGSAAATGVIAAAPRSRSRMPARHDLVRVHVAVIGVVYAIGHIRRPHQPAVTLGLAVSASFLAGRPGTLLPGVGALIGALGYLVTWARRQRLPRRRHSYNRHHGIRPRTLIGRSALAILVFVVFGVIRPPRGARWARCDRIGGLRHYHHPRHRPPEQPSTRLASGRHGLARALSRLGATGRGTCYLIGEFAGGILGGLAYMACRAPPERRLTSLAPTTRTTRRSLAQHTHLGSDHEELIKPGHPGGRCAGRMPPRIRTRRGHRERSSRGPRATAGKVAWCPAAEPHEPLHGGFVGYGMLDAACPASVHSRPTRCSPPQAVNAGPASCTS